jgi:hypothetical protein
MNENWVDAAEAQVLEALEEGERVPHDLSEVVSSIRKDHRQFQVAQLKVAALNLVTKGRARIDADWRLVAL